MWFFLGIVIGIVIGIVAGLVIGKKVWGPKWYDTSEGINRRLMKSKF